MAATNDQVNRASNNKRPREQEDAAETEVNERVKRCRTPADGKDALNDFKKMVKQTSKWIREENESASDSDEDEHEDCREYTWLQAPLWAEMTVLVRRHPELLEEARVLVTDRIFDESDDDVEHVEIFDEVLRNFVVDARVPPDFLEALRDYIETFLQNAEYDAWKGGRLASMVRVLDAHFPNRFDSFFKVVCWTQSVVEHRIDSDLTDYEEFMTALAGRMSRPERRLFLLVGEHFSFWDPSEPDIRAVTQLMYEFTESLHEGEVDRVRAVRLRKLLRSMHFESAKQYRRSALDLCTAFAELGPSECPEGYEKLWEIPVKTQSLQKMCAQVISEYGINKSALPKLIRQQVARNALHRSYHGV